MTQGCPISCGVPCLQPRLARWCQEAPSLPFPPLTPQGPGQAQRAVRWSRRQRFAGSRFRWTRAGAAGAAAWGRGRLSYVWAGGPRHLSPPTRSEQSLLPVQDVADVGAGADSEEQCPGLQGSAEQAMQAGRDHGGRGAAHTTGPAENAFQAVEARHQVLGTQGASGNGSGAELGSRCSITCAQRPLTWTSAAAT